MTWRVEEQFQKYETPNLTAWHLCCLGFKNLYYYWCASFVNQILRRLAILFCVHQDISWNSMRRMSLEEFSGSLAGNKVSNALYSLCLAQWSNLLNRLISLHILNTTSFSKTSCAFLWFYDCFFIILLSWERLLLFWKWRVGWLGDIFQMSHSPLPEIWDSGNYFMKP